jgi:alpha-beta hydrolase superfamily lysophospholipase
MYNCIPHGHVTIIIPGFGESIQATPWIKESINNFLALRGNCVFLMDYTVFGPVRTVKWYLYLWQHFFGISAVLKKKIEDIGAPENTVMFGFSFGSRLAIDVGHDLAMEGKQVDKIYACDPAGPGFTAYPADKRHFSRLKDPKKAANFVQCINTSVDKGTHYYDCHQNWR